MAELQILKIVPELTGTMADWDDFIPNPWNPNRMDAGTRAKLVTSMRVDGFFSPLLVRPHPTRPGKWEIIDGEQRWTVAGEAYVKGKLPYINLGAIGDAQAKTLTARANALRGEWDAVALAAMVNDITADLGRIEAEELLPWTAERIDSMIDLHNASITMTPEMLAGSLVAAESGVGGGASDARGGEFKSFDPNNQQMAHTCPRCKFAFND